MSMKKDTSQIKYIAYSRKSTDSEDRQILSLNDQKREVENVEQQENLKVVEKWLGNEHGESQSAHKRGRPIFNHVMQQVEAGKGNGLLVWHPNRLARNAYDGGWIITAMDEGKLIEVKTTSGRTYYNTPEDKFFLQLEFGMAKKSSDDNGVAVRRGLKTKLGMGWRPNRAPLGYLNTKNFEEKGKNFILKDQDRYDIVKQAWQMFLMGNRIMQIKEWCDKQGLKTRPTRKYPFGMPVSRSVWYDIFTNPFYYGWYEYPNKSGDWHKGKHEPMILPEEFDRAQILLGRKGKPRPKKHKFAFTGLMRCASCGAMITAEEKIKRQKNGNVHHYIYYHCTKRINPDCTEKAIELNELNAQIDSVLAGLNISEKFQQWAIKYLHEIRQNEARAHESSLETAQKRMMEITKQLDNLVLLYTSPKNTNEEFLSSQELQSAKAILLKEKASLEDNLQAVGKKIEGWMELSEKTFHFARYARIWFAKGDMETKRAIFACLGSHHVLKDQKVLISLQKPFNFIFESVPQVEKELAQVRTYENAMNKGQIMEILAKCPTLRWVEDSNLCGAFETPAV